MHWLANGLGSISFQKLGQICGLLTGWVYTFPDYFCANFWEITSIVSASRRIWSEWLNGTKAQCRPYVNLRYKTLPMLQSFRLSTSNHPLFSISWIVVCASLARHWDCRVSFPSFYFPPSRESCNTTYYRHPTFLGHAGKSVAPISHRSRTSGSTAVAALHSVSRPVSTGKKWL